MTYRVAILSDVHVEDIPMAKAAIDFDHKKGRTTCIPGGPPYTVVFQVSDFVLDQIKLHPDYGFGAILWEEQI